MSDVLLFQSVDGGEIRASNGQIELTSGLEVAALLSCFGGNTEDSGLTADDALQWWANHDETNPDKRYRSELQHLLKTLTLIPANLIRFEDAAVHDLSWMQQSVADSVAARATMPGIDQVKVAIAIVINGQTSSFVLTPPKAQQ
jgi:hypothetical protein